MSRKIDLYTTVGCHLCEEALGLLQQAQANGCDIRICEVEIAESESLLEAYGIRIPVIRAEGRDEELGWPFDYDTLIEFIED